MMRKMIFVLFAMLSLSMAAQEKAIQCDSVIQAQGLDSKEIYQRVKGWVAEAYNEASEVIQLDDAEQGVMVCKGNFEYRAPGGWSYRNIDGYIRYTLKVQVRDGRFKVSMGDFDHESKDIQYRKIWSFGLLTDREKYKMKGVQDKRWTTCWPDMKKKSLEYFEHICSALKGAMSGQSSLDDGNDDW